MNPARDRKEEHIRLALEQRMQMAGAGFDAYRLEHCALPELDYAEIDTSTTFLGKPLRAPLLISCMTGGTLAATRINERLAEAAEATGVALGVGSQRKALEDPAQAESFRVRHRAPTVPLLANLGAVQLNYGYGVEHCRRAVEMIEADALVLHLNPLQEAIQPEGQCNFSGLLAKIRAVVAELPVPVIVKEVGSGISGAVARQLLPCGVTWIDCAGAGGTSWARIEAARAGDAGLAEVFGDWGISTPESIVALARMPGLHVIGSGGLRSGVDVAKALALGAELAGMAYPFLRAAEHSSEAVEATVRRTVRELTISMFCVGARTVADLKDVRCTRREST